MENSYAQYDIKIGFADVQFIMERLPDMKKADIELQSMQKQLQHQIEMKTKELEQKYQQYLKDESKMLETVKANTEREIQLLNDNLQKLKEESAAMLQKKESALLEPIYKKLNEAVAAVAREQNFNLILNTNVREVRMILYGDDKVDITQQVLKKLSAPATASK
jgi:outer membrane protein